MKVDLQNKVAVVTGAAGAIGSATAKLLSQNGAIVYLNDVNAERLQNIADSLTAEGLTVHAFTGDVSREEDMKALIGAAADRYGHVDILVNNAGLNVGNELRKPMWEYDPSAWRRVMDVCIDSVYLCSKYALPAMINAGGGRIVNIASVAGWRAPLRLQSVYSAAKAGIENLSRSMAIDYAKNGINVNTVVPGSIMNGNLGSLIYDNPEKNRSMAEHIPAGHTGAPVDIANAVLFLVSPDARYITGCTLNVDGGWAAGYALDIAEA